ncbi:MAG: choice-of-anchor J domain-containing protein [Candidatus Hydrothermia bacterium]
MWIWFFVTSFTLKQVQSRPLTNWNESEKVNFQEVTLINYYKRFQALPETPIPIEADPILQGSDPLVKADRDTFKYDQDGTTVYYPVTTTYKYFWAKFPISYHRPSYSPSDSTFILTGVAVLVYNPLDVPCTLKVYDKYNQLVRRITYNLTLVNGLRWFEIPVNPPVNLYDTFLVMIYLPTSQQGFNYYNQPTLDPAAPIDTGLTGYFYNNTYYYYPNYDFRIRAIGHFEQIHDASAWEMVFPTHPYSIAQPETLKWNVYNFGNFDENIPTKVVFNYDTVSLNVSVLRKSYSTLSLGFTPLQEGFLFTKFWTELSNDYDRSNDTFPDYWIYVFPKYTTYGEDFDFINSLQGAGWKVLNLDNDSYQWTIYTALYYSHSGWSFAVSYYNASGNNDWLISPAIPVQDTFATSFGFFARAFSSSYPESLEVWIMSSTNSRDTIEALYRGRLTTTYQRFTYSLDKYRGRNVYIGFRNAGINQRFIFLDDFFVRQVPLLQTCLLREEFEEILTPPGWWVEGNLWRGGRPSDAGVPDIGRGNLFYFTSSATSGSYSTLFSPVFKANLPENKFSYRFLYHNADGSDYVEVWYRVDNGNWVYHRTYYLTTEWDTILGGPITLPGSKGTYNLQFKLVAYADGGQSNIAIDDFEVHSGTVLPVAYAKPRPKFLITESRNQLEIRLEGINKEVRMTLFDVQGRKVAEKIAKRDGSYTIKGLRMGIYYLILDGDVQDRRKVIILQ